MDIAGVMKGEGEVPYLPKGMAGMYALLYMREACLPILEFFMYVNGYGSVCPHTRPLKQCDYSLP